MIEDPQMKHDLRVAAEAEEEVNYSGRMNDQWLNALAPIGTDADKSYYDKVPYIIVIFKITHSYNDGVQRVRAIGEGCLALTAVQLARSSRTTTSSAPSALQQAC